MPDVLFLGDGSLATAARYVAGVLTRHRLTFDHVATASRPARRLDPRQYRLVLVSDYPAALLGRDGMRRVVDAVGRGTGLLMVGGWASFGAPAGRYRDTPLGLILPVACGRTDDRVQGAFSYRMVAGRDGPLPGVDVRTAPGLAGYNRLRARPAGRELLAVETIEAGRDGALRVTRRDPLLVAGQHGDGRVGAFAGDLAPHWSGGLVDWGRRRVALRGRGAGDAEVGAAYVAFVHALVKRFLSRP